MNANANLSARSGRYRSRFCIECQLACGRRLSLPFTRLSFPHPHVWRMVWGGTIPFLPTLLTGHQWSYYEIVLDRKLRQDVAFHCLSRDLRSRGPPARVKPDFCKIGRRPHKEERIEWR